MARQPQARAYIVKTYGGHEGQRIKAGTIFDVNSSGDAGTITQQRFADLKKSRIATEYNSDKHGPDGMQRRPLAKIEPDSAPPAGPLTSGSITRSSARSSARRGNTPKPSEPALLKAADDGISPTGGQTGGEELPSLSQVAPALANATLRQRGERSATQSNGSASTPATSDAGGQMPSTPATAPGGDTTGETSSNTEVLE